MFNVASVTALVSMLLNLAVLPFLLRAVTLRRYGEWATLAAVLAVAQLADAGIATDIARRVAAAQGRGRPEDARRVVQSGLSVLFVLALLMVVVAFVTADPLLSVLFPGAGRSEMATLHAVYGGVIGLLAAGLVLSGWLAALAGLQRSDFSAWGGLAGVVVGPAVMVASAHMGLGLWALFAGAAAQNVAAWTPPALALRRLRPDIRLRVTRVGFGAALAYVGMPAMILVASVGNMFDYQFDKLVLSHYRGPSVAGGYQIGLNIALQVQALALLPLGVLTAATAELHEAQPEKLRRLERLATSAALGLGSTLTGGVVIFAPAFFQIWLGNGYDTAAFVARWLGLSVLIGLAAAPWYYYAVGRGLYGYIVVGAGVNIVVNAACTLLLTAHLGVTGAVVGSMSGNIAATAVAWSILRRREKRPWLRPALRPFAAAAAATLPAWFAVSRWQPHDWIQLGLGVIAYVCLVAMWLRLLHAIPVGLRWRKSVPIPMFDERALA